MQGKLMRCFSPEDFAEEFDTYIKDHAFKRVTWIELSPLCIACHVVDSSGRDTVGSVSFIDGADFRIIKACELSLLDAIRKGAGHDTRDKDGVKREVGPSQLQLVDSPEV